MNHAAFLKNISMECNDLEYTHHLLYNIVSNSIQSSSLVLFPCQSSSCSITTEMTQFQESNMDSFSTFMTVDDLRWMGNGA
jgi:hypothetical protein